MSNDAETNDANLLSSVDLKAKVVSLRRQHRSLAQQHAEAKNRVYEYQSRRYLSQREHLECRALQRLKLAKKDAIVALENELSVLEAQLQERFQVQ